MTGFLLLQDREIVERNGKKVLSGKSQTSALVRIICDVVSLSMKTLYCAAFTAKNTNMGSRLTYHAVLLFKLTHSLAVLYRLKGWLVEIPLYKYPKACHFFCRIKGLHTNLYLIGISIFILWRYLKSMYDSHRLDPTEQYP